MTCRSRRTIFYYRKLHLPFTLANCRKLISIWVVTLHIALHICLLGLMKIVVGLSLSSDCISIVQRQKQFMRCFLIIVFLGFLWLHWKRRRSGDFSSVIFSFSLLLTRPRDFPLYFFITKFSFTVSHIYNISLYKYNGIID